MAKDADRGPVLDNVDPAKREFIGKLIGTSAFVAPLVASFSMSNVASAGPIIVNNSLPK